METTMSNGSEPPRTVVQAAAELNLKPTTVRAWISQRRIGHVRLGRAVRIPYSEIRRVLEAGFVPASPSGRR